MSIETHANQPREVPDHVSTKESSLKILLEDKDGNPKTEEQVISFINKYAPFFSGIGPGKYNQMRDNLIDAIKRWSKLEKNIDERKKKVSNIFSYLYEKIPTLQNVENRIPEMENYVTEQIKYFIQSHAPKHSPDSRISQEELSDELKDFEEKLISWAEETYKDINNNDGEKDRLTALATSEWRQKLYKGNSEQVKKLGFELRFPPEDEDDYDNGL